MITGNKNSLKGKLSSFNAFYKAIGISLIILSFSISASAQKWTVFTKSNSNLPDNDITKIAVEKDGTKWIGTHEGLVEIDGNNWKIYDPSNSPLPYKSIEEITVSEDGTKWIGIDRGGASGGGLVKYDDTSWQIYNTSNSKLPDNRVNSIAISSNRTKWVGTSKGLVKIDSNEWKIYKEANSEIPGEDVITVEIAKDDTKWVGTNLGIASLKSGNWKKYYSSNSKLPHGVNTITIADNNVKWVGTSMGLARLENNEWTVLNETDSGMALSDVEVIKITQNGTLMIGSYNSDTYEGGLTFYDGKTWKNYDKWNSKLPWDAVSTIAIEDSTVKWIGTMGASDDAGGLAKLTGKGITAITEKTFSSSDFKTFPNPAQNQLNLKLKTPTQPQTYTLHTLTGQKAQSGKLDHKGIQSVDISNLSPDVYLLEVKGEDAVRTKKVVIE